MLKPNITINANHDQQAKLENTNQPNTGTLINECWSIISTGITELLPMFFSQLDDDLFKLSEKAETNLIQTQLFEAMRFFRREREGMQTQFFERLSVKYDEYWAQPSKKLQAVPRKDDMGEDGLSLIDDEVLEESLAVNGMIEKGNSIYQLQLYQLNERFCHLSGKENQAENLPVSPDVLCRKFSMILRPMEVDIKVKLVIYKNFDRQILSKFGSVYQTINSYLADNGVLPSIANKARKQGIYTDESGRPIQATDGNEAADISGYLETFRTMQSLMDTWRLQLGMPSFASTAMPGAAIADSMEVLNVMDSFQIPSSEAAMSGQPMSAESLKQQLALQLGKVKGNSLGKTIGRPEEDIIDMVGIMFDYILDDNNMAPAIKCLIARLQIPIIKVAILDKTFFAKKNHASRILLNDLAQAGIGLTVAEISADNPIIQKIEEIVTKILNEFGQDITLYDDLLKDFTAFMEKESKRSLIAENRTLQTTQSKEKVWLAKKAVASEITLRMQNVDAPLFFRTFIYNDWKDVLLLAYLRRDKNDGEWERSLETLDKMIWSITPPSSQQERANLIREIPAIVKAIREGLESTSLDAHQLESLLKELETCHMHALHPSASLKTSEKPSQTQDVESILPTKDVDIKDAELAEAILEIKSFLPDISNVDVEEVIIIGGEETISQKEASGWLKDFVKDKHSEAANRLKVGDWVGFMNEDGQVWRAKLAWKSPATSLCVFVNRRGVKVLELKLNDLALRMRQGRANVIEGASIPLMDRAVSFLTQSLQNPFAKPSEMPSFA